MTLPRPCSAARPLPRPTVPGVPGCRAFEHGNHPDCTVSGPPAGLVIPIGGREEPGIGISFAPGADAVEGGARVAIVTASDLMSEDAQSAFLERPRGAAGGTVLILTAADEERLLRPSDRVAFRIRLGPVARREVEACWRGRARGCALAARLCPAVRRPPR